MVTDEKITDVDVKTVEQARGARDKILGELHKVIIGQEDLVERVLISVFAGGHILLVGVPGLAKTLLVSTLAKTMSIGFRRIQFTPDMMPSDITGTEILEEDHTTGRKQFVFVQGPVFTNLLLADEINRTPPKTQAALMEAMQEKQVTAGKKTYPLAEPFMVMATQNPIEQEGTYPLPEAQLDRFMCNLWVDYPTEAELTQIVKTTTARGFAEPQPVLTGPDIIEMRRLVRQIPISDHVLSYIVRLVTATHIKTGNVPPAAKKYIDWGVGPRAGQFLSLGAKSRALLRGNLQATVEDVRFVAHSVLRHRIVINFAAVADGVTSDAVIDQLLEAVPETVFTGCRRYIMPVASPTPTRFLDPQILRSIESIELRARLLVEGMYASRHRCPYYGYSVEFKDYREYSPGDDPRVIDWKMLARTERFWVKRFEMESNMNVVPILDVSGSMGYQPTNRDRLTKLEYGCYLAAALAYLASKQQDSPGLIVFDREIRTFLPPRQGQRHLFTLLARLAALQGTGETDLAAVLKKAGLHLRRRSLLILISDCHGEETGVTDAIKQLAARGHDLVVFHLLDQDEVDFPFQMLTSFRDVESNVQMMCDPLRQRPEYEKRLGTFRDAIRSGSLAGGADYRFLHTGLPIEAVLREYLLYRRRIA